MSAIHVPHEDDTRAARRAGASRPASRIDTPGAILAWLACVGVFGCAAGGPDRSPAGADAQTVLPSTDTAGNEDSTYGATADGEDEEPRGSQPTPRKELPALDLGPTTPVPPPCVAQIVPAYEELVRPHLEPCRGCHNTLVPAEWMPHGGPQWFDPNDASVTLTEILARDLLNPEAPELSMLILKPLPVVEGGANHAGGEHFPLASPDYEDMLEFATQSAWCAAE